MSPRLAPMILSSLLVAPLSATAEELPAQLWTDDVAEQERPALLLPSLDATRGFEPIPDVATPAATMTSATFTGALSLGPALSLSTELAQPDGDGPALVPSALVGATLAQAIGAVELAALVGRTIDPAAPTFAPEAAVLELALSLPGALAPSVALRRTTGPGASTELDAGVAAALSDDVTLEVVGRTVASGGALDAGALAVIALR